MNAERKIGVILPSITDCVDYELLQGIYSQSEKLLYDTLVFTSIDNFYPDTLSDGYFNGQENIYELPFLGKLDGIIFVAGRFYNENLRKRIYDNLRKVNIPCIVLEDRNDGFESLFTSQRESIKMLTDHLVYTHNYKKIYFLAGSENNNEDCEKLAGFLDSLNEAGISVESTRIFYGDFGNENTTQLVKGITSGVIPKPEAIVCTNDIMAVSLCKSLEEYNICVPEEIVVTGYGKSINIVMSNLPITTIVGDDYHLVELAVCKLFEKITGEQQNCSVKNQPLKYGVSCDCNYNIDRIKYLNSKLLEQIHQKQVFMKSFLPTDLIAKMSDASIDGGLSDMINSLEDLFSNLEWLDICLCEDWKLSYDNSSTYRTSGYSEKMLLFLSKRYSLKSEKVEPFEINKLLPALTMPHKSKFIVFTPLHFQEQVFGYIASGYNNVNDFSMDEAYMTCCSAVSNGIQILQKRMYEVQFMQHLKSYIVHNTNADMYNQKNFYKKIYEFITKHKNGISLIISYNQCEYSMSKTKYDMSTLFTNALQLSLHSDDILIEFTDNLFVVFTSIPDVANYAEYVENFIINLEQLIIDLQNEVINPLKPYIFSEIIILNNTNPNIITKHIEEKIKDMSQKLKALKNRMPDYSEQLKQLRREIKISPELEWNICDISTRLGISISHFYRLYKLQFKVSFKDEIISERIKKAKKLLSRTKMQVQEISEQCGYSCSSHFMRQFKSREGITALEYRKNNSQNDLEIKEIHNIRTVRSKERFNLDSEIIWYKATK